MKFAVIGLGFFGFALSKELSEAGHEVLAIDTDESHVRAIRDHVDMAVVADGTDVGALHQLGVSDVDTAVVAIGEGFEASLMITAHLQNLKVRRIYTRVINDVHGHLLDLMNVTGKINAEGLAAAYFSRQITNEAVLRYFGIDQDHGIVELELPDSYAGKTLEQLKFRSRHGLNVITIRRPKNPGNPASGEEPDYVTTGPAGPDFQLKSGDRLVVFGGLRDIENFCAGFN